MTTNTIKANPFAIFTAAHAEARRLRENWPTVAYRDLFRAALKRAYEELRNLNAKIARKVREAAKSGIEGFGRIFHRIAKAVALRQKAIEDAARPMTTAEKLTKMGCKVWTRKGTRIYLNAHYVDVIANLDDLTASEIDQCSEIYFDADKEEWCLAPKAAKFNPEFTAKSRRDSKF